MLKQIIKTAIPSFLWNYLRLKKLKYSIENFSPYIVEKNYCGFKMKSFISDGLSKGWYDRDWSMLPEVEFLKSKTLRNGSLVFDLGAHQGIVAQILAKTIEPDGKVIAVEANLHNYKTFQKNLELNECRNITIIHAAISDKEGMLYFNESPNGKVDDGSAEWGRVETKATTIDSLVTLYGTPSLVFIDVEGFEENALVGAAKFFNDIQSWFIEVHADYQLQSFGGSVEKIISRFSTKNYDLYVANEEVKEFMPLNLNLDIMKLMIKKRFFLIALKK